MSFLPKKDRALEHPPLREAASLAPSSEIRPQKQFREQGDQLKARVESDDSSNRDQGKVIRERPYPQRSGPSNSDLVPLAPFPSPRKSDEEDIQRQADQDRSVREEASKRKEEAARRDTEKIETRATANLLDAKKQLSDPTSKERGVQRLREIIAEYESSVAAKEARQILDGMGRDAVATGTEKAEELALRTSGQNHTNPKRKRVVNRSLACASG